MRPGIIVAMDSEFDALRLCGIEEVARSGVGKANAARAATEMILSSRPDCIISSGVAGGIGENVRQGDVVVASASAYHDVWCGEGWLQGQVMGEDRLFPSSALLLEKAASIASDRPMGVHFGLICTGDQFLTSPEEADKVLSIYPEGLACDMESAAIAQTCAHYGIPFLSLRVISDTMRTKEEQKESYSNFWKTITSRSFEYLKQLIDIL